MTYSEDQVRDLVRKTLLRTLGPSGVEGTGAPAARVPTVPSVSRPIVSEADVLAVQPGGLLSIPAGAMVTPLARDTARERGVKLVDGPATPGVAAQPVVTPSVSGKKAVALGADHGGFEMKEDLKVYLGDLGYEVVDCGPNTTASVDYPDYAYAVAQLVSSGQAWRGIMVDGVGIGSCMVANKVPGVRASMCYDHATAVNAREHNDANVLTLGGVLIGSNLARQIVKTWLETDFGGGRHARRVDKIMDVEARFIK